MSRPFSKDPEIRKTICIPTSIWDDTLPKGLEFHGTRLVYLVIKGLESEAIESKKGVNLIVLILY